MAFPKKILGTRGREDDRKQTPEEIAEERIEEARKATAPSWTSASLA